MRVGIFITARLGSSRLKRKHLLPVGGKPVISYLLARIASEFTEEIATDKIVTVITSSDEPENRDFECFTSSGVKVFYGAVDNIPLRHLQAAEALKMDAIVAVDGDDILCSFRAMRAVYEELSAEAQYVRTKGLPFGMNCFGYATKFLAASLAGHRTKVLETGWGKIFDDAKVIEVEMNGPPADDRLRFTLDYEDDYRFFAAVIEAIGEEIAIADDETVVRVVDRSGFYHINEMIAQEYWANFYRCMEIEKEM